MNILVTGGAGYIGSHCSHLLLDSGYKVIIVDNLSKGVSNSIPPQANFIKGDIGDKDFIKNVLIENKIDTVIHCAAFIEAEESIHSPFKYYKNNTVNTLSLIEACIESKVFQFVFSSTAAIYGEPESIPVRECAEKNPVTPYALSKWMSEQVLERLAQSFDQKLPAKDRFRYISLRYFNVAGASSKYRIGQISDNSTHLIKIACETSVGKRQSMKVFGNDYNTEDGTCVRDFIHVDDLASAHLNALEYLNKGEDSNVFNCGYGQGYSVKQVLETFKKVNNIELNIEQAERRKGDLPALISNPNKIKEVLNWAPKYNDLDFICKSAYEWETYLNSTQA